MAKKIVSLQTVLMLHTSQTPEFYEGIPNRRKTNTLYISDI